MTEKDREKGEKEKERRLRITRFSRGIWDILNIAQFHKSYLVEKGFNVMLALPFNEMMLIENNKALK